MLEPIIVWTLEQKKLYIHIYNSNIKDKKKKKTYRMDLIMLKFYINSDILRIQITIRILQYESQYGKSPHLKHTTSFTYVLIFSIKPKWEITTC